ncbi:MAG: serine--tRNA ligase [Trueperaceae bacterium]|nr:serine--tRNA ligase [Trueperaceae bacterium]
MLDLKYLRDNPQAVRNAIDAKQLPGAAETLDRLLMLDEEYRILRSDLEEKQARRNADSKKIGDLKRRGENADDLIREMGELSDDVKKLEEKARVLAAQIEELMLEIPNPPHDSVPYGRSEHDNVVVFEKGERRDFSFTPKPHWELAKARGWLDLEAGAAITGSGFPVFRGDGARFMRALVQFLLNTLADEGYTEVMVPLMVNAESATGTAQLPDKEGQMYEVSDGFYMIPTAETPVTNLHRGEILDTTDLPIRYAAYSPCFRREAGSYGKEVRGINRVHQFDKVEMVQFVDPATSYDVLEAMTEFSEGVLAKLGLPYRRLSMCSGDMGFAQAKKYDLEVWSAGQDRWLEVSSVSNFETFQARRLQTRYRDGGAQGQGKPNYVHTLNGSCLGMVRTWAALVEHYQNEDGTVDVPDVVRPYMGKDRLS